MGCLPPRAGFSGSPVRCGHMPGIDSTKGEGIGRRKTNAGSGTALFIVTKRNTPAQGYAVVKPTLLIFKPIGGYGYLFLIMPSHSLG